MVKRKLKNLANLGSWSTYKGILTWKKKNENKENVSHLLWKWWITASLTWQAGATIIYPFKPKEEEAKIVPYHQLLSVQLPGSSQKSIASLRKPWACTRDHPRQLPLPFTNGRYTGRQCGYDGWCACDYLSWCQQTNKWVQRGQCRHTAMAMCQTGKWFRVCRYANGKPSSTKWRTSWWQC